MLSMERVQQCIFNVIDETVWKAHGYNETNNEIKNKCYPHFTIDNYFRFYFII